MAVYPFYTSIDSSTRKSLASAGCRSKEGNMTTHVYQRNQGCIEEPYTIRQFTTLDNETGKRICTSVVEFKGEVVHSYDTEY